jgi:hypothetical protein
VRRTSPRSDVDRNTVGARRLTHLADVQASAYLEVEFLRVLLQPARGADRADRRLERCPEPIACSVDDPAACAARAAPIRTAYDAAESVATAWPAGLTSSQVISEHWANDRPAVGARD